MEKKNTVLLTVIAIATLFVAIVGATFAYFATGGTNEANLPVDVKTPAGAASFSSVSNDEIAIDISAQQMDQSLVTSAAVAYDDDATVTVKLKGVDGGGTSNCKYDLVWTWDTDSDEYVPTESASTATPEFSVAISKVVDEGTSQEVLSETQISDSLLGSTNMAAEDSFNLLSQEEIEAVDDELDSTVTEVTAVYTITVKFYNMMVAQPAAVQGKNYKAHITVSDPSCSQQS